jgi:hypothetical protein
MDVLAKARKVCGILSRPIRWYSNAIDHRLLATLLDESLTGVDDSDEVAGEG